MKYPTLLAILLSTFASLPAAPEAKQDLSVRALAFQPGFPAEIHAHNSAGSATAGLIQIKSYLNHEFNLLNIKGNQLVFTTTASPSSATDVNQVCGQIEVPPKLKSAILLFLPESENRENHKCRVMVIDDGDKEFPAGSFKVANFSELALKLELEGEAHELAPGQVKVIKAKFEETQSVSMRAFVKRGDEWKLISTSSWPDPGTKRVLQVVYKDLATNEIQLKGVRDAASR